MKLVSSANLLTPAAGVPAFACVEMSTHVHVYQRMIPAAAADALLKAPGQESRYILSRSSLAACCPIRISPITPPIDHNPQATCAKGNGGAPFVFGTCPVPLVPLHPEALVGIIMRSLGRYPKCDGALACCMLDDQIQSVPATYLVL
jgi:hypothetical protein